MKRRISSSPASLCAIGVLLGAACFPSWAGEPYLVKDINPAPGAGGFPWVYAVVNGKFLMLADDGVNGRELWVSDGTEAGTYMVKDIVPGPDGSEPQGFANVNGKLFFMADNNVDGLDLWVSDGTSDGTRIVKEIVPGPPTEQTGSLTAGSSAKYTKGAIRIGERVRWSYRHVGGNHGFA